MVTKHFERFIDNVNSIILAKIHMVTKLNDSLQAQNDRIILAKIHMVTKPPHMLDMI